MSKYLTKCENSFLINLRKEIWSNADIPLTMKERIFNLAERLMKFHKKHEKELAT